MRDISAGMWWRMSDAHSIRLARGCAALGLGLGAGFIVYNMIETKAVDAVSWLVDFGIVAACCSLAAHWGGLRRGVRWFCIEWALVLGLFHLYFGILFWPISIIVLVAIFMYPQIWGFEFLLWLPVGVGFFWLQSRPE
jgi:hypothetical protein